MAATAKAEDVYQIVATTFDQAFYRATNPDLNLTDFDPIWHYLEYGWREERDPAPWFSVRRYLQRHPDVAASGREPLRHYMEQGVREDRAVFMSDHAAAYQRDYGETWSYVPETRPLTLASQEEPTPRPFDDADWRVVGPRFNSGFYREAYPDVVAKGVDPMEHFLTVGWREGRDPTPQFCVREYLQDNPDVAATGINPFVHYIVAGRAEGRAPRRVEGFRLKIAADLTSLEARVAEAADRARIAEPAADFAAAAAPSRTGLKDLHVTFSHDDYTANLGGVQLCLQYEAQQMAGLGRDHLHLCPTTSWPVLRRSEPGSLAAILNGRAIGVFSAHAVAEGLAALRRPEGRGQATRGSFAIHNLLGHSVDEVLEILEAASLSEGAFWLHDFTSLCAGYQLLRNDVEDCAAPPPDSPACGICLYGPGRMPQVAEHERLFRKLRLTVASPSQVTLDFWRDRSSYPTAATVVHPHVRLIPRPPAQPSPEPGRSEPRPLRLAFLGFPSAHKGWPVFAGLAADYADDPRYRFLHLGAQRDPRTTIEFHPVSVSLAEPRAMQQALEALEIDVAVIWSIFRETFCLAAYEAIAAGAAIVTSPESANVAALVAGEGRGRVLADEAALRQALADGDLLALARSIRQPRLYDLAFSGMTADLPLASAAA
ncbi:hypothetical protein LJR225_004108 [Phenylobacterium sp. LjRoot225]|uniref:hypothetical protein n=1 Tax=Phenylobacterium sp. LjRoot225 TaxID=3342285 RepID=UPI003ECE6246